MTNSILLQIYDDLEAMTVTYTDKSGTPINPNCFNLDEIPASINTAQLPCRILLPVGQGQSGSPNIKILKGAGVSAAWQVTDLFLLETAARDIGIYIQAPVLMHYAVAYAESLGVAFQFKHGWNVESLTISAGVTPGMYEYPSQSGVWFYGVKCDVIIEEIF
jgi:hypothetical protein